ncbi:MAG: molybdopterin-dependent oxidoreductase [Planctomycetota bacterium]
MKVTRRDFLKISAAGAAGLITASKAFGAGNEDVIEVRPRGFRGKIGSSDRRYVVCPFCSVGCNLVMYLRDDQIIHIEADIESPINGEPTVMQQAGKVFRSHICPKAFSGWHMVQRSTKRLEKVQVRKAGSDTWSEIEYPPAIKEVAERIAKTRDASFIRRSYEGFANRCEGIAFIGGSNLTNEVCYGAAKLFRSLGLVYIDGQIRDTVAPSTAALKKTFGRAGGTNHFSDIANSKLVMIIGANPAADAPVAMKWAFDASDKNGAKIICVDSRLTQTAAKANIHARIRPGTDLVLIAGIINKVLQNKAYTPPYVLQYTDASLVLDKDFYSAFDREGIFSGLIDDKYNRSTWRYRLNEKGLPVSDETMSEPRTVLNVLKKHFQRYEPDTVCRITGIRYKMFEEICKMFCEAGSQGNTASILFGRGVMQQTQSTQVIRALGILQLLLGNIGVPGGGLIPLYPEGNAQGAADFGLMYEYLPGYMEMPNESDSTLKDYLQRNTPKSNNPNSFNEMKNYKKYLVSLLKAFYGPNATAGNDFCFDYLPRVKTGKDYSIHAIFEAIEEGTIKGLVVFGENPALGPNGVFRRKALSKLEWLVVYDSFENETAAFWKSVREDIKDSKTDVYLFPATLLGEHRGTYTNSCRWIQWQDKGLVSIPQARKDGLTLLTDLFENLKEIYSSEGEFREAVSKLFWNYPEDEMRTSKTELVMLEIAGQKLKEGIAFNVNQAVESMYELAADGSTVAGNYLYCGCAKKELFNRDKYIFGDSSGLGIYSGWAFSWPSNVRIMYNRADVNPKTGNPWNLICYVTSYATKAWISNDVIDGPEDAPEEIKPFTVLPQGVGHLFVSDMLDGPIPEYYEPLESLTKNVLPGNRQLSPVQKIRKYDTIAIASSDKKEELYTLIAVTFGLAEHYMQHVGTRSIAVTKELTPKFFVEIDHELAGKLGLSTGDKIIVKSPRLPDGIGAYVVVTKRLEPLEINGIKQHIVGIPDNFGFIGLVPDTASAFDLSPYSGDMNSSSAACRSFLCAIVKA